MIATLIHNVYSPFLRNDINALWYRLKHQCRGVECLFGCLTRVVYTPSICLECWSGCIVFPCGQIVCLHRLFGYLHILSRFLNYLADCLDCRCSCVECLSGCLNHVFGYLNILSRCLSAYLSARNVGLSLQSLSPCRLFVCYLDHLFGCLYIFLRCLDYLSGCLDCPCRYVELQTRNIWQPCLEIHVFIITK